jgi:hypothetical protein
MSSKDYKEFKRIIKDKTFKTQSSKLIDCSVKIFTNKIKGLAKTLITMMESDSESEPEPEPEPEQEPDDDYKEFLKWKASSLTLKK